MKPFYVQLNIQRPQRKSLTLSIQFNSPHQVTPYFSATFDILQRRLRFISVCCRGENCGDGKERSRRRCYSKSHFKFAARAQRQLGPLG